MASVERQVRLLDQLRQSELLTAEQLAALAGEPAADSDDPKPLAKVVLQKSWLTQFQMKQVLRGQGKALVLGPYQILDHIGEGGMGHVYKAHHVRMHRTVALKLIRKEKLANPGAVKRFYQEVQAAAQLHHPNIVIAYDAGQYGTSHYLAMEYVDGVDLARLVKESGPLPVIQACDYIRQAALGLQHAFERGLVHRDIKPANLLVTRSAPAEVKILDMGLARLAANQASGVTHDGAVLGTPDYLAPEQALDAKNADIRSDIYSLGCTFYFLLTGRPPYAGTSLTEILLKHQMEPLVPPEQVRPEVPRAVGAIVAKLLAKRPEDRFQTPAQVAAALEPFSRGDFSVTAVTAVSQVGDAGADWQSLTQGDDQGMAALRDAAATDRTAVVARPSSVELATKKPAQDRRFWLLVGLGGGLPVLAGVLVLVFFLTRPKPKPAPDPNPIPPPVVAENKTPVQSEAATNPAVPPNKDETTPRVDTAPPRLDTPPPRVGNPPPPVDLGPLAAGELRRLGDGRKFLQKFALLPDGKRALAGFGSDLVVWDLTTGGVVRRVPADRILIRHLAVSRDGRSAVYVGSDYVIHVWDVEAGQETQQLKGHTGEIRALALSPDGRLALSGGGVPRIRDGQIVKENGQQVYDDLGVRIWDTTTGQELRRFLGHPNLLQAIAVSPDGKQVISRSYDGRAALWDIETLAEAPNFKLPPTGMTSTAFSPDGKRALVGGLDRSLTLVELPSGEEVRRITGLESPIHAVAFMPGGKLAITGSGMTVSRDGVLVPSDCVLRLWDLEAGRPLGQFTGHKQPIVAVAATAAGDQLLSSGMDNTLRSWDLSRIPGMPNMPSPTPPKPTTTPTRAPFEGHTLPVTCVAWSRDGKRIVTGSRDKTVRLWDAENGKEIHVFKSARDEIRHVAFSRDGKKIAADDKVGIHVWDADTHASLGSLSLSVTMNVTSVAFSSDAKQVIYSEIGDGRSSIHPWVLAGGTGIPSVTAPAGLGITSALLSDDGTLVIYGCDDGTLHIRGVGDRKELPPSQVGRHPIACLALSPKATAANFQVLAGSGAATTAAGKPAAASRALTLWNLSGFVRSFSGHTDQVTSVVFLPDGKRALSGSKDKTVRLWEVASGNQVKKFEGHEGPVLGVAVAPDGKKAVSVGDGIRVWDLQKMVAAQ